MPRTARAADDMRQWSWALGAVAACTPVRWVQVPSAVIQADSSEQAAWSASETARCHGHLRVHYDEGMVQAGSDSSGVVVWRYQRRLARVECASARRAG